MDILDDTTDINPDIVQQIQDTMDYLDDVTKGIKNDPVFMKKEQDAADLFDKEVWENDTTSIENPIEETSAQDMELWEKIYEREGIDPLTGESIEHWSGPVPEGEEEISLTDLVEDDPVPVIDESAIPEGINSADIGPYEIDEVTQELIDLGFENDWTAPVELGTDILEESVECLLTTELETGAAEASAEAVSLLARYGLEGAAAAAGEVVGAVAAVANPVLAVAGAVLAVKGVVDIIGGINEFHDNIIMQQVSLLSSSKKSNDSTRKLIENYNTHTAKKTLREEYIHDYILNWKNPKRYWGGRKRPYFDDNWKFHYKSDYPVLSGYGEFKDKKKYDIFGSHELTWQQKHNMYAEKYPTTYKKYWDKRKSVADFLAKRLSRMDVYGLSIAEYEKGEKIYKSLKKNLLFYTDDDILKSIYDNINEAQEFQDFINNKYTSYSGKYVNPTQTFTNKMLGTIDKDIQNYYKKQVMNDPGYAAAKLADEKDPENIRLPRKRQIQPFWVVYYTKNKRRLNFF